MIKKIYGMYDCVSGNVGDVCILDKDEEFIRGAVAVLAHSDVPTYIANDMVCVCYGELEYNDGMTPVVHGYPVPVVLLRGDSIEVRNARKENKNEEDF